MASINVAQPAQVITSVRNSITVLRDIRNNLPAEYFKDVKAGAEMIGETADYYCPKDTLELVKSKKIVVTNNVGKDRIEISIQYGGPDAPYAIYVHENPPDRQQHDPPTCYKWLERASREVAPQISPMIASLLDSYIHGFGSFTSGGRVGFDVGGFNMG